MDFPLMSVLQQAGTGDYLGSVYQELAQDIVYANPMNLLVSWRIMTPDALSKTKNRPKI